MSNKRITDLTELTTPTSDDVFPVVDIATNTTQKVQLGNLPVQSAVTTALATKQDTLVSGTNIKTVNSTSILGSGNISIPTTSPSGVSGAIQFSNGSAFASDAANLFWDDTNKRLGVGTNSPTTPLQINGRSTFISLSGSALGTTTANAAAQFYINGQSSILAVSGYFNVGSEMQTYLSSGASVGGSMILQRQSGTINIGGASGSAKVNITGSGSTSSSTSLSVINSAGSAIFTIKDDLTIGIGLTNPTARTHIQGSGSTSATTSLLVQNSSAFTSLKTLDNGEVLIYPSTTYPTDTSFRSYQSGGLAVVGLISDRLTVTGGGANDTYIQGYGTFLHYERFRGLVINNSSSATLSTTPSALVEIQSTTQGFLPPKMTTTQKNAIASPASGLVVYDSTTNKLQCYNGSTWNDLF